MFQRVRSLLALKGPPDIAQGEALGLRIRFKQALKGRPKGLSRFGSDSRSTGFVSVLLLLAAAALAVIALVIVATISLAVILGTHSSFMGMLSAGKSIDVAVYSDGKRVDRQIPALNGASVGYSGSYGYSMPGQSVSVKTDEDYKVVADAHGQFTVTMHRVVEKNGDQVITDTTLPVWKTEPEANKRVKLPDGSAAAAYLDSH